MEDQEIQEATSDKNTGSSTLLSGEERTNKIEVDLVKLYERTDNLQKNTENLLSKTEDLQKGIQNQRDELKDNKNLILLGFIFLLVTVAAMVISSFNERKATYESLLERLNAVEQGQQNNQIRYLRIR